jgi:hypothetical protein
MSYSESGIQGVNELKRFHFKPSWAGLHEKWKLEQSHNWGSRQNKFGH